MKNHRGIIRNSKQIKLNSVKVFTEPRKFRRTQKKKKNTLSDLKATGKVYLRWLKIVSD